MIKKGCCYSTISSGHGIVVSAWGNCFERVCSVDPLFLCDDDVYLSSSTVYKDRSVAYLVDMTGQALMRFAQSPASQRPALKKIRN